MPKEVTDNYGVKWVTIEDSDGAQGKVTEKAFDEVWKDKGWKRVGAKTPEPFNQESPPKKADAKEKS